MAAIDNKRIRIVFHERAASYAVPACFGLEDIVFYAIPYLFIAAVLITVGYLCHTYAINFEEISPYGWINRGFTFAFGNIATLSKWLVIVVAFCALVSIIYRISPRTIWVSNSKLFCKVKYAGFFPITYGLPFDRITKIDIAKYGTTNIHLHSLGVKYQKQLPCFVNKVLKQINPKLIHGRLLLAVGIQDLQEAEHFQTRLLADILSGS